MSGGVYLPSIKVDIKSLSDTFSVSGGKNAAATFLKFKDDLKF